MAVTPEKIGKFTLEQPGYKPETDLSVNISKLVSNIIGIITIIAGLTFVYYFMVGAISWITSAGDVQKAQTARLQILNAVIGLTITALAYTIAFVLSKLFGIPFNEPLEFINSLVFT